jgi:hypothetical protein
MAGEPGGSSAFKSARLLKNAPSIECLRAENRVLREKLGKKRILLNDDQRRLLAVKGKILGRKMLEQITTIVTPETILRWHRELVAAKWDYSQCRKKIGRPDIPIQKWRRTPPRKIEARTSNGSPIYYQLSKRR